MDPIRIDIVSDFVCPWCVIGFKQLEKAVGISGVGTVVHWHPFELNPDMPQEGENLRDHVARKYGSSRESSDRARDRLTAMGAELGFDFSYADDTRMRNTFRGHQLIRWANEQGRGHQMKMALFSAFFTDGKDVNDAEVLADMAADNGFDRTEATAVLAEERYAQAVREEEHFWTSQGIQGVPAMIFQRKYLVSGAQGVENYRTILQQVIEQEGLAAE